MRWWGPRHPQAFGILTYHRVADGVGRDPALLNVTPRRFRRQLAGLLRLGYEPWPLRRLVDSHTRGEAIPRRAFAVVFDDGYADTYYHAWPVLRELKVPATVFLATAYLDSEQRFPFDDWSTDGAANSRPLTTDQCREMQSSGVIDLGSHTHQHADFRRRADQFAADLRESLTLLEKRFQITAAAFSFPYGYVEPESVAAARRLGVSCGLTAECELVTPAQDPFHWGRFGATQLDTPLSLAAKLDGWYSWLQTTWRRVRRRGRVFETQHLDE